MSTPNLHTIREAAIALKSGPLDEEQRYQLAHALEIACDTVEGLHRASLDAHAGHAARLEKERDEALKAARGAGIADTDTQTGEPFGLVRVVQMLAERLEAVREQELSRTWERDEARAQALYSARVWKEEADEARAALTDPNGTPWRERAFDCARDIREALGYDRDAAVLWGDLVRWVHRATRERDEARAEVARLKSATIVRRPIATLPKERGGRVLLFRPDLDGAYMQTVTHLEPGDEVWPWPVQGTEVGWRWWCPVPPLADDPDGEKQGAEPPISRDRLYAALRDCDPEPMPWEMVKARGDMTEALEYGRDEGRRETLLELLADSEDEQVVSYSEGFGLDYDRHEEQPAEPEALTLDALRPLMVEGWEMPEAPEEGMRPTAYADVHGWYVHWMDDHGNEEEMDWPFRPGVTVTAEHFRVLGFVVEE